VPFLLAFSFAIITCGVFTDVLSFLLNITIYIFVLIWLEFGKLLLQQISTESFVSENREL